MIRLILIAVAFLAGCANTNDSGVVLLGKPDLSSVAPGTPIDKVAALTKPLRREPIVTGDHGGAEMWIYEWDLPDDGVNNRMFTSVVVKDGVIVSFTEETAEKWKQDPQLHMAAKVDSALEDVSSLNATAARYQRMASLRENYNAAPYAETWELLMERTRFIRRDNSLNAGTENAVSPAVVPATESPAFVSAPPPSAAPSEFDAPPVEPPRKTLRQLEAEELGIRKDPALTKKERLRRLHEVWKQQREVMSADALAEN